MLESIRCLGAVDLFIQGPHSSTPPFPTPLPPVWHSLRCRAKLGMEGLGGGKNLVPVEGSFGEDPTRWGRVLGVGAPVWPTNRRG